MACLCQCNAAAKVPDVLEGGARFYKTHTGVKQNKSVSFPF
jgi:hypothetical protein